MPELLDYLPDGRLSNEQRRAGAMPELDFSGLMFAAADAANSEQIIPWAFRQIDRERLAVEPGFKLTPELVKTLGNGLPDDMLDSFSGATSLDQAWMIRQQMLGVNQSRENLSKAGMTGVALRFGANMLDPVSLAVTAATAGVGGEAVYGAQLTRLARFVRGGLLAGGAEAATQGYLATQDPERSYKDVLWAAAGGMVIGGGLNALLSPAAKAMQKGLEYEDFSTLADQLTPEGRIYFRSELAGEPQAKLSESIAANAEFPPKSNVTASEITDYMESARVPDVVYNGVDLNFRDVSDAPSGLLGRIRFGIAGRLEASSIPAVRKLGRMMVENVLTPTDGKPVTFSASEWAHQERNVRMARFYRETLPSLNKFTESLPTNAKGTAMDAFYRRVGLAARDAGDMLDRDPHVLAAVRVLRREQAELLDLAKRYKVKGFEDIAENPGYVPRIFNQSAIIKAINTFGHSEVVRMIGESMMRKSPHLDVDTATKFARGYLKIIQDTARHTDLVKSRIFKPDQAEALQRILKEVGGLDDETIQDVLFTAVERNPEKNVSARAKARVDLDEQHSITTPSGTLSMTDLFENDAAKLMETYTRQIVGHSAMSEVYHAMARSEGDIIENFEQLATRVRDEAAAAGLGPKQMRKMERDLGRLEAAYRNIMGIPQSGDPLTKEVTGAIRAFNHMRIMGMAGFPQLAETGMIIANVGLRATLEAVPALKSIFKRAASGELTTPLLREIESLGIGTEALRHQIISRFDSAEAAAEFSGSRLGRLMEKGVRFTNNYSMMVPIMVAQQRFAAVAAIQNWADSALSGVFPSARRLASLGMTEADARAIGDQFIAHAERASGSSKIIQINLDKWEPNAASKFIVAMDKWSRRVIQSNDIGQYATWMTRDMGKVMTQMRGFTIAAWEKQFLFNLQQRDWQAFTGLAWTMMFGGLAYVAQQHLVSLGRKDRKDFLKERLSFKQIAGAAWTRSGYSSIIPDMAEYMAGIDLGGSPFMNDDALLGNPTASLLQDMFKARRAVSQTVGGDPVTQKDFRALSRLVPFQNMLGVRNTLQAMTDRVPEDQD